MMILGLVRNYIPSHQIVVDGGWNIADAASARSYDLEGMQVGTVAAGRIGSAVLRRLKPFDVGLHYTDRHRLPAEVESELGATFHESTAEMVPEMDVVTINAPLHPETEHLFDEEMIGRMKRGAYIVNTARGKICDRDAIAAALESGQLAGYAGDVWFPQPPPQRPSLADDAARGDDPAHLGHQPLGAGALRGRHPGDPRVPLRRQADPRRVPDRPGRSAGRSRRPLLQRRRRDRRARRRPRASARRSRAQAARPSRRAPRPQPADEVPPLASSRSAVCRSAGELTLKKIRCGSPKRATLVLGDTNGSSAATASRIAAPSASASRSALARPRASSGRAAARAGRRPRTPRPAPRAGRARRAASPARTACRRRSRRPPRPALAPSAASTPVSGWRGSLGSLSTAAVERRQRRVGLGDDHRLEPGRADGADDRVAISGRPASSTSAFGAPIRRLGPPASTAPTVTGALHIPSLAAD